MLTKKKLISTAILSAILGGSLLLSACGSADMNTSSAESNGPDNSKVLATFDNGKITENDLIKAKNSLPSQYASMPMDQLRPTLMQKAIADKLLAIESVKYKIKDSAEYKTQLKVSREQILNQMVFEKLVQNFFTDEMIQKEYNKIYTPHTPQIEIKARHILVKTKKDATRILAKLKKGGNFAKLALQYSTGPSKKSGGELGWFAKNQMVPEFSAEAFKLKDNAYGIAHTTFGWHVIQTEQHRPKAIPKLDAKIKAEIKNKLIQSQGQALASQILNKLQAEYHLKTIDNHE